MCKEVEKVLEENSISEGTENAMCSVNLEGKELSTNDFVAVLSKENGDIAIFYNTDAYTLGIAVKLVSKAFVDIMHRLPEEERNNVQEMLGGDFEVGGEEHE